MPSRSLRAHRLHIKLPAQPYLWLAVVGVGREPQIDTLTPGTAYCDLGVGSIVETRSHGRREIVEIEIEDEERQARSVDQWRQVVRG